MTPEESFTKFKKERTRLVPLEKVTLKEIIKAFNRWSVVSGAKKLKAEELEKLCEEHFGDSRGKREYIHLRVFLDEEDLEEFDNEQATEETTEPSIVNPCTDAVPSDKMANYILNSEKKIELVRGLIEDKRALSSEIDELEKKIEALEQYQRGSINFINHLLKKMENPPR